MTKLIRVWAPISYGDVVLAIAGQPILPTPVSALITTNPQFYIEPSFDGSLNLCTVIAYGVTSFSIVTAATPGGLMFSPMPVIEQGILIGGHPTQLPR